VYNKRAFHKLETWHFWKILFEALRIKMKAHFILMAHLSRPKNVELRQNLEQIDQIFKRNRKVPRALRLVNSSPDEL